MLSQKVFNCQQLTVTSMLFIFGFHLKLTVLPGWGHSLQSWFVDIRRPSLALSRSLPRISRPKAPVELAELCSALP